ncbi:MAG: DMT family transporter [Nonlabens sp.]
MKDLHKAIIFMIASSLAFSFMNILVKYLEDFSAFQIVFFRSSMTLVFLTAYLRHQKIDLFGNEKLLLWLRGIFGTISLILFFISLGYLKVGMAVVLRYLSPIFAAIMAVIWLKEQIKPLQWLFFGLAFSGVLMIKGVDGSVNTVGLVLILISAFFLGLVFVTISKIGKRDHPIVIINYFMLTGVIVGGLVCLFDWKTPVGMEWLQLIAIGVVSFTGQIFMTKAFQIASTNQVAPIKYLEVVFTVIMGATLFTEVYTLWALAGMFLVIAGLILNIWYKSRISKPLV